MAARCRCGRMECVRQDYGGGGRLWTEGEADCAARWGQRAQVVAANWKQPVADLDFEKSENWKIRGPFKKQRASCALYGWG